jgi:cytochrome d ubiquinol oxidase subunit I
MIKVQPMKMAAAEALWETENPAAMSLLTIGNEAERRDLFVFKVPGLLSFLAYNRFEGEVKGIKNLQNEYEAIYGPGDYVPPVAVSYWTFRLMIGAGMLMLFLALYGLYLTLRNRFEQQRWYLIVLVGAVILPHVANATGWLFTEIARQPWIVFGLQRTAEAVSPNVPAGTVLFSLISFTLIYALLMAANIYLMIKFATQGAGQDQGTEAVEWVPGLPKSVALK